MSSPAARNPGVELHPRTARSSPQTRGDRIAPQNIPREDWNSGGAEVVCPRAEIKVATGESRARAPPERHVQGGTREAANDPLRQRKILNQMAYYSDRGSVALNRIRKDGPDILSFVNISLEKSPLSTGGNAMMVLLIGSAVSGLVLGATSRIDFILGASFMAATVAAVLFVRVDIDVGFAALAATLLNGGFLLGIAISRLLPRLLVYALRH